MVESEHTKAVERKQEKIAKQTSDDRGDSRSWQIAEPAPEDRRESGRWQLRWDVARRLLRPTCIARNHIYLRVSGNLVRFSYKGISTRNNNAVI